MTHLPLPRHLTPFWLSAQQAHPLQSKTLQNGQTMNIKIPFNADDADEVVGLSPFATIAPSPGSPTNARRVGEVHQKMIR